MAKILVVDDDTDICGLLALRLAAEGHTVTTEHDGEAALAAVEQEPPDALLLDWMMPRLGGIEVCLALRADPRWADIPVLMLTARSQAPDVRRALAAGADGYLVKPFSPRDVIDWVTRSLPASSARRS